MRHTLAYHSAATSIYSRVKGELETNRYALVEELQREIEDGRHIDGGDLDCVAEELLEHMQGAREDVKLVAEVYDLIQRYIDLVREPRAAEPEAYDGYLWDSIDQRPAMSAIVNPFAPESSERAYCITPASNLIAITRLVLYASRRGDAGDVRAELTDAIRTNREAVGPGEDDELGVLSTYVTSRYAGDASAREKNDGDPVVYSIRRTLAEQEAAIGVRRISASEHIQAVFVFAASLLIACADDKCVGEQKLPTVPEDAEAAARILGLATHGYGVESLEEIYAQTIEIDQRLVGSGTGADDLGTLSDYIASRYSGTASAREKNEADPIAYIIRRMLREQQAALEQWSFSAPRLPKPPSYVPHRANVTHTGVHR